MDAFTRTWFPRAVLTAWVAFLGASVVMALVSFFGGSQHPLTAKALLNPTVTWKFVTAMCMFIPLYHAGGTLQKILGLRTRANGMIYFLSLHFVLQLALVLAGLDSMETEFLLVWILLGLLIGRSRWPHIAISLAALATLHFLPQEAFLQPSCAGDEAIFWIPTTQAFIEGGLRHSMLQSPLPGYGLLVPGFWSTLHHLASGNPAASINSGALVMAPMAVLLVLETPFAQPVRRVLAAALALLLYRDSWVFTMMGGSILGEGSAALLLTGFLVESLHGNRSPVHWIVTGATFLTKPFASILAFAVPWLLAASEGLERFRKERLRTLLPCLLVFVVPLAWMLASKRLGLSSSHYKVSGEYNQAGRILFDPSTAVPILQRWLTHKSTVVFYLLTFLSFAALATRRHLSAKAVIPMLLMAGNIALVFLLHMTLWVDQDKQSPFRYASETFYLGFLVLGAFLESMKWPAGKESSRV